MIIKNSDSNKVIGLMAVRAYLTAEIKLLKAKLEYQQARELVSSYEAETLKTFPTAKLNEELDFEVPDDNS